MNYVHATGHTKYETALWVVKINLDRIPISIYNLSLLIENCTSSKFTLTSNTTILLWYFVLYIHKGLLTRYANFRAVHASGMPEHFPHQWLQRTPLAISDPGRHHDTWPTHVPWCMLESLTRSGRENVPGIPRTCAVQNLTYLTRVLWVVSNQHVQLFIADVFSYVTYHTLGYLWQFGQVGKSGWYPLQGCQDQGTLSLSCPEKSFMLTEEQ